MSVTNRETIRDSFTTLLSSALVGTGKPAQAVYGYQVGDFSNMTPVVTVSGGGIERSQSAVATREMLRVYLNVHIFVLYSDQDSWGEDDAEDRVDLIENTIAQTICDNRTHDNWVNIQYSGRTQMGSLEISGIEYRWEVIPIRVDAYDN